ncbi:MAG: hypothetical protein IK025_05735 [Bacteroidales bacterium]|nr:hypothetical protein [Bacteroidales bacterium]
MNTILKIIPIILLLIFTSNYMYSQNVITLKNGEKIYFQKLKTSADYIEYTTDSVAKKNVIISKGEISTVLYNGITTDYSAFTQQTETENNVIMTDPFSNKIVLNYVDEFATFSSKKKSAYLQIFAEYSEAAYFKYKRGIDILPKGKKCIIAAGATFGIGTIISVAIKSKTVSKYFMYGTIVATTALLEVGIPLVCVGKARIRKSFELYNIDYNRVHAQNGLSLNVGYTGTGLSLALNF